MEAAASLVITSAKNPLNDSTTPVNNSLNSQDSNTSYLDDCSTERSQSSVLNTTPQQSHNICGSNNHKGTIITKPSSLQRMTGTEINRAIPSHNTVTSTVAVDIISQKSKVETFCRCDKNADILKRDLQQNQVLNKFLSFVGKSTILQISILLGVPEAITTDYITAYLENNYNFCTDEIKMPKHQPSRSQGLKIWIILLSPSLLKVIIRDEGLSIGLKLCRVRHLTSVLHCHKCQIFGRRKSSVRMKNSGTTAGMDITLTAVHVALPVLSFP